MTTSERRVRSVILDVVSDLVAGFLYYDRKESESLPRGAIEQALGTGVITFDEIVSAFRSEMVAGLSAGGGDA
jgi:hypothetical protein